MRSLLPKLICAALVVAFGTYEASAQDSDLKKPLQMRTIQKPAGIQWKKEHARAFFNTNIGSFKLIATDQDPVEGTLDVVFRGTILISNLEPGSTVVVSGNVRKEIDDKKYKRQVYFGNGRITISGRLRSVQFFGQGLRAGFDGFGFGRLYGEFDRNLETGYYWLDGDEDKTPWGTGGMPMAVPPPNFVKPKVKIQGKGG